MVKERSIRATVDVAANVDQVWTLACATDRFAEWVENTVRMSPSAGTACLGYTYGEVTRIIGPWTANTEWRVTEFDPMRRQVHQGHGLALVCAMEVVMEIAATDPGTRFTLTFRYTPRFGTLGAIIDRVNVAKLTKAQQRSVAAFAALVEGPSTGSHLPT